MKLEQELDERIVEKKKKLEEYNEEFKSFKSESDQLIKETTEKIISQYDSKMKSYDEISKIIDSKLDNWNSKIKDLRNYKKEYEKELKESNEKKRMNEQRIKKIEHQLYPKIVLKFMLSSSKSDMISIIMKINETVVNSGEFNKLLKYDKLDEPTINELFKLMRPESICFFHLFPNYKDLIAVLTKSFEGPYTKIYIDNGEVLNKEFWTELKNIDSKSSTNRTLPLSYTPCAD